MHEDVKLYHRVSTNIFLQGRFSWSVFNIAGRCYGKEGGKLVLLVV